MTHLCLTGAGAAAGDISSPLGLSPTFWLRPDSGVYTGGSRTLVAGDKSGFSASSFAAVNLGTGDALIAFSANRSATGNQVIFDKYQDSDNYYRLEFDSSHKLHFIAKVSGTTKVEITSTTAYSTTGVWLHGLVAIDRSAAATTSIYVNGANDTAGTSTTSTDSIDNTGTFYVGQSGATTLFLAGSIASLGIAKPTDVTTVAAAAATSLHNLGNAKSYAELTAAEVAAWNVTWWANCNEQDQTAGLTDQHSTNDLARTAAELITNGGFADGTAWTTNWDGTGAGISGGVLNAICTGDGDPTSCDCYQNFGTIKSGRSYTAVYTATVTSGTIGRKINNGDAWAETDSGYVATIAGSGTSTTTFTATADGTRIHFYKTNSAAASIAIDNVSVKSAAVAVGNGPAECCATNSGSGTGLDGRFVGVSAAGLVTNWKTDVPTPLAGQGGYSFLFDGVDDYCLVSVTGFRSSDSSGTIAAWIKTTGTNGAIFASCDNAATGTVLMLYTSPTGKLAFHQRNADASYDRVFGNTTINDGVWHHVAVVSNGTAWKIYVDGADEGVLTVDVGSNTGDWFADTNATTRDNVVIGANVRTSVDNFFAGNIDDVRVYSETFTPAQIAQLYSGSEATGATPVGHWSFDPPDGPWGVPSDGDPVWMVESQEAYRYQLAQTTAGNRPVQRVAAINSKPALEFDGASDYLRVASVVPFAAAATIACVVQPDDVILGTPATQAIIAVQDEGSANNFIWLGLDAAGKFTVQGNNAATAFTVTGATVLSDDTAYILIAQWDGTNWNLSINGTAETETRTGTEVAPASISGMDSITLGARYSNATASTWYDGLLAEPVVDTAYSVSQINTLLRHWKKRYAIT